MGWQVDQRHKKCLKQLCSQRCDGIRHRMEQITFYPLFKRIFILSALLCGFSCSAQAAVYPEDADKPTAVSRTVLGIISYARWPVQPEIYRLCTVGETGNLRGLTEKENVVAGHPLVVKTTNPPGDQWLNDCDILYLAVPPTQRSTLLKQVQNKPVLTMEEGDGLCTDGSMFCLDVQSEKFSFQANLDSIARSGIRINANVLLLLRRK